MLPCHRAIVIGKSYLVPEACLAYLYPSRPDPCRRHFRHDDRARGGVWACDDHHQGAREQRREVYRDGQRMQVRMCRLADEAWIVRISNVASVDWYNWEDLNGSGTQGNGAAPDVMEFCRHDGRDAYGIRVGHMSEW